MGRRTAEVDRVRIAFDDAPLALAVCDSAGTVLDVNRAFCALASRTPPEILGVQLLELIEPSRREQFAGEFAALLSGTPAAECEVRFLGRPGLTRRVMLHLKRTEAGAGQPIVLVDGVDSATDARSDEARESFNAMLAQVALEWTETFDAVAIPIMMLDADLRVRRLNRAAAETAGAEFRHILHRCIEALGPGEPWQTAALLAHRAFVEGTLQTMEACDDVAGTHWEISASIADVNAAGDERVVVTTRNVTAMRNLQESARRAELLSTLGSLVAGVAHEVRNPLFGISATFDAFAAEHRNLPSIGEYLVAFRRDLRRLKELMNDLLEYGKPSVPVMTRQPFAPIVHQAVSVCQALAAQQDVTMAVALSDGLPDVDVDADRIVVVFKNLIENAIAFSGRGGEVTITASPTTANDRVSVSWSVADSGPGFAPTDMKRIFEPFYTRRTGGTGLGLALVQRIVTDHGGTVTALNRRGAGALMTVLLPGVAES